MISSRFAPTPWANRLPGVELRVLNPDREGIGEVAAHSKTVMSHYLDDPELTRRNHCRWLAADRRSGAFDDAAGICNFSAVRKT